MGRLAAAGCALLLVGASCGAPPVAETATSAPAPSSPSGTLAPIVSPTQPPPSTSAPATQAPASSSPPAASPPATASRAPTVAPTIAAPPPTSTTQVVPVIPTLPPSGISGRVTAFGTGAAIARVVVYVFYASPCCTTVANASTDSVGAYAVALPNGSYIVNFSPPSTSPYAPQYWRGVKSPVGATAVTVSNVGVAGIDATLVPGFVVSGIVVDKAGVPVSNAPVIVNDPAAGGGYVIALRTDPSGGYRTTLLNGTYRLSVYAPTQNCCPGPPPASLSVIVSGADQTAPAVTLP